MNSLLEHVAGGLATLGIPAARNMETPTESSRSFSEHFQQAVTAGPKVVPKAGGVQTQATAAKPSVSGAVKAATGVAPLSAAGHTDSEAAPDAADEGLVSKGKSAGASAAGESSEQASNTDSPWGSGTGTEASPRDAAAPIAGRLSIGQLAASAAGKASSPQAALETPNDPSRSSAALGTLGVTQLPTPVPMSFDFTLSVTQPLAPAETNSAQADGEPVSCAAEPGVSGETTSPQPGSTECAGGSASSDNAAVAGNNNPAAAAKSEPAQSGQANSFPPAVASMPIESAPVPDTKEASQDSPRAADESTTKPSASHDTASTPAPASRENALPAGPALTGSLNVIGPLSSASNGGNAFLQAASLGNAGDRDAPAGSQSHSDVSLAESSPAVSTESAVTGQVPAWPAPLPASNGDLSVSFNGTLTSSTVTTNGQNAAAVSLDRSTPGPALNVTGLGSAPSSAVVAFQPQSGSGVMSDSSPQGSAQAEGTPRPMGNAALETWQNVSAQLERVNGATLDSLANGTEMRVQMHTDAFGPLEIRATLEAGKIGAAIGVENPEAHHTLLSQVSALQQSLADRHVQLDQVSVVKTSGQNLTDLGWSSNQRGDDSAPYSRLARHAREQDSASEPAIVPEPDAEQTPGLWGRLSVRA